LKFEEDVFDILPDLAMTCFQVEKQIYCFDFIMFIKVLVVVTRLSEGWRRVPRNSVENQQLGHAPRSG